MASYHISGVPITAEDGLLVGILTNRDLRFHEDGGQPVSALMTSRDLVTALSGRPSRRRGRSSAATASRSSPSSTRRAGCEA